MAAGETALAHLVRAGVPQRLLGEALAGFGAALPPGLPEPAATVQPMTAPEITRRWLAALANEALRLLDLGIARRPSDIDHALVAGHGFPRWQGGPMHQAELRGLMVLRRDLRRWAEEHPVWSPAPLIDRLIQDGLRLPDLEG
jgi:3-hydroxyacyl-CoA dehydrogenase